MGREVKVFILFSGHLFAKSHTNICTMFTDTTPACRPGARRESGCIPWASRTTWGRSRRLWRCQYQWAEPEQEIWFRLFQKNLFADLSQPWHQSPISQTMSKFRQLVNREQHTHTLQKEQMITDYNFLTNLSSSTHYHLPSVPHNIQPRRHHRLLEPQVLCA